MLSVFDIFKIGIGPSSSHTVGPMLAGHEFAQTLTKKKLLARTGRVQVELYGSLALTGEGHGTMGAVLGGLEGNVPATVDTDLLARRVSSLLQGDALQLGGSHAVPFAYDKDMLTHKGLFLSRHSNAMKLSAFTRAGKELFAEVYYSTGGGFICTEKEFDSAEDERPSPPYPFTCADELFAICHYHQKTVAEVVFANEIFWQSEEEVIRQLREVFAVMRDGIERGCTRQGVLPGGYQVRRRAADLLQKLTAIEIGDHGDLNLWPMLYAFAMAEENASGGRVVTAPTNGAAGVIPAVLMYYYTFYPHASEQGVFDFLLTAGVIGMFYKINASISGAEVGCQGEVGVACSMAAGAYCAVTGGSIKQVEVAAEIGMEHNLGLTCDPVGGLVQIPCIERNGVAAERAIKCAQLAALEDGSGRVVTLDQVIQVMYRTGLDLQARYKETSLGGLAAIIKKKLC